MSNDTDSRNDYFSSLNSKNCFFNSFDEEYSKANFSLFASMSLPDTDFHEHSKEISELNVFCEDQGSTVFLEKYNSQKESINKLGDYYLQIVNLVFSCLNLEDSRLQNTLSMYPLLYLIRHTLELHLKAISFQINAKINKNHNLRKLWESIKSPLTDYFNNYEESIGHSIEDKIKVVDKMVELFEKIDFSSTETRYSGCSKVKKIDINNLKIIYVHSMEILRFFRNQRDRDDEL